MFPVPDRKGNFGFNPLIVDNVMYVLGPKNAIVALDAATGKQRWAHVPEGGSPGNRGINYWESKDRSNRRLIFAAGIRSMDRSTLINVKTLGQERIKKTIRTGQNQMPAFHEQMLSERQLDNLLAYLVDPVPGAGGSLGSPTPLPAIAGMTRYFGPLGTLFRVNNGLPAVRPPWAQIVAVDLNEGTIKWRAPLGTVRALAAKGIKDTGSPERIHRNGPVVTAGGLIFIGT